MRDTAEITISSRSLHMKSDFKYNALEYDWQTCFISSGNDMNPLEVRDLG